MARILLIEDAKEIVEIITMLLHYGQHEVISAIDGVAGLEAARRELPDIILLDIRLPKMDGMMVNHHLLNDPKTRSIPVIVISTQSPHENVMLKAENVKLYLQKPFDLMTLLDKIRQVLSPAQ